MFKIYISASTQNKNIGVAGYGTEEDRMHQLADRVKYWLETQKGKYQIYRNKKGWTLKQTVEDCNGRDCDLFIDNHTNAGPSKAEGTEVFYHTGSADGKRFAEILYKNIAPLSPGKDRGVREDTSLYDNGLYVTRNTNCAAALIEHIFHTNIAEVEHFTKYIDEYAKAEAKAIVKYFGQTWFEPTTLNQSIEFLHNKILTDRKKWLDKAIKDMDIYYLLTKGDAYIKTLLDEIQDLKEIIKNKEVK